MPKLQLLKNGQYLLTVPRGIIKTLHAQAGDKIEFYVDLKKGKVWVERI